MEPDPLQLPHVGEHLRLCFTQAQLILVQSVLQLYQITRRSSSGAGRKSVYTSAAN